jgi:diguanylate cyclase (GGDEF)-like protein/PAS domain S-box-containing protein
MINVNKFHFIGLHLKPKAIFLLSLTLLMILGALFIHITWKVNLQETRDKSIRLAETAEASLQKSMINNLEVTLGDTEKPEYNEIKDSLSKLVSVNNGIRFAYIYTQRDSMIYIMADSEPADSEDYSPPGQEYVEASQANFQPFKDGKTLVTEPYTDRWGFWVSVFVPMKDSRTEEIIAVLGIDYPAEDWNNYAVRHTLEASILVFCLFLVLLFFYRITLKNIKLKEEKNKLSIVSEKLKESERSKSILLNNLPGMAYRCNYDRNWTMQFVSNGCFELTGYKAESLLQNKVLSYNEIIHPDYQDILWNMWGEVVASKAAFKYEAPIITASGEIKWVLEQGQAIYDENGEVVALEGLIIDISDRKKREEETRYVSEHDYLTGLYNRRYFEQELQRMDNKRYLPLSIIIGDINGLKLINDAFGHAEGDKLIVETAKILKGCCRENDIIARMGGDEFCVLLPNADSETTYDVLERIKTACKDYNKSLINDVIYLNISLGYETKQSEEENFDKVRKNAETYMYKRKLLEQKSSYSAIISSIKATMFERSQETEEHAERLTEMTKKVGMLLNLSQMKLDDLELLCTLHDIGKVGVDDRILKKPGELIREEWIEMKKHPEIGYRIAIALPELAPIAEYILTHHERWDGKGYPHGIKNEEIPLLARILSVVDAYDAMTKDRVYRKAMTKEEAIVELKRNAGTQFDPKVVSLFIEKVLDENFIDDTR